MTSPLFPSDIASSDLASQRRPSSPYQGLIPFSEDDQSWFFGRSEESEVLAANLRARQFTVLYGPSGVGKTSLLRAGVAPRIRNTTLEEDSRTVVVVFDHWGVSDPLGSLRRLLAGALDLSVPATVSEDSSRGRTLFELVHSYEARDVDQVLLIMDQFEEYFRYTQDPMAAGTIGAELPALLNDPAEKTNVLLCLRDDRIATLDVFKTHIPALLSNLIRLDPLDREGAREAIVGPAEKFNSIPDNRRITIEPDLVQSVLDQVSRGQISLGHSGQGLQVEESGYEAPFLQLVMARLWDTAIQSGQASLGRTTLDELGGANQMVQNHLDVTLGSLDAGDKTTVARMLSRLVTPSGTKIAHQLGDLTVWGRVHESRGQAILQWLDEARLLRTVESYPDRPSETRYELYHDVLAAPALAWTAQQERIDGELAKKDRRALIWGLVSLPGYFAPVGLWFSGAALLAKPKKRPTRWKARIGFGISLLGLGILLFILSQVPVDP